MSESFTKIVRPGTVNLWGTVNRSLFCKIEFKDGRLSFTGVEGPMSNGNCMGGCGQIDMHEWKFTKYAKGWDAERVREFREIWKLWHLNDMRAGCEHQVGPDWEARQIKVYRFRRKTEVSRRRREIEEAAGEAIRKCVPFQPTPEESALYALEYELSVGEPQLSAEIAEFYEPAKPLYSGDKGEVATVWNTSVDFETDSRGLLSKPCNECGYHYGSAWRRVSVPENVLQWLKALPDTDVQPAWV